MCISLKCKETGVSAAASEQPSTFSGTQAGRGNPGVLCHLLLVSFGLWLSSSPVHTVTIKSWWELPTCNMHSEAILKFNMFENKIQSLS